MDKSLSFTEWCTIMNMSIIDFNVDTTALIQWFGIDIFNICTMFIRKYVIDKKMKSLTLKFKLNINIDIILYLKELQNIINEFNYKINLAITNACDLAITSVCDLDIENTCDLKKFKTSQLESNLFLLLCVLPYYLEGNPK